MLRIIDHGNVFVRLSTRSNEIIEIIRKHFTYVRSGWKGNRPYTQKKCIIEKGRYLYKGLLEELLELLEENGIEYDIDESLIKKNNLPKHVMQNFLTKLKPTPYPRYYQEECVKAVLEDKMRTVFSPTGSGKSLIAYLMIMFYMAMKTGKKALLVVPSTGLISQMFKDFRDYSSENEKIDIKKMCKGIHGKSRDKTFENEKILITDWQWLRNRPKKFLEQFGLLVWDEAHGADAREATMLINSCVNVDFKMGLTGTLPEDNIIKQKQVEGMLGQRIVSISTREMIDMEFACDLKICSVLLNHGPHEKQKYREEVETILYSEKRNLRIINLLTKVKGNTLVLFKTAKKPFPYGKQLASRMSESKKRIYYIDGDTTVEERDKIKENIEKYDNCILIASYGTTATGISIKNLHNIVFAESMASEIKVLQSIGRGLRVHESKDHVKIFDIVDVFEYKDVYHPYGYMYEHWLKRERYYSREEFDYVIKEFDL